MWAARKRIWTLLHLILLGIPSQSFVRLFHQRSSLHPKRRPNIHSAVTQQSPEGKAVATKQITLDSDEARREYARTAKARVLELIPSLSDDPAGHERMKLLLDGLSAVHAYNPIMTSAFLELALGGTWRLVYTTAALRGGSARMRLIEITQTITPSSALPKDDNDVAADPSEEKLEGDDAPDAASDVSFGKGQLDTVLEWSFAEGPEKGGPEADASATDLRAGVEESGLSVTRGTFKISSAYSVNPKGDLVLSFDEDNGGYELSPTSTTTSTATTAGGGGGSSAQPGGGASAHAEKAGSAPPSPAGKEESPLYSSPPAPFPALPPFVRLRDPVALCALLERACPTDLFAPHDVMLKTTYVDENFRVLEAFGESLRGERTRAVFVRV